MQSFTRWLWMSGSSQGAAEIPEVGVGVPGVPCVVGSWLRLPGSAGALAVGEAAALPTQRCLARASHPHSGHSRAVPSSSSSVAQPDTHSSLAIPGGHCPARLPAASCPPARPCGHCGQQPLCPGWSPPHWAQQSTGCSSFQSCHFFFISDFTCHGGEGAGAYPWLCPPCRHRVGWGSRAGGAMAGTRTGQGRYLLVGKAVQHSHQEALQGEPAVSPPPSLS